ncbi:NACHT domain-containing protein [Trichoderma barbatum]
MAISEENFRRPTSTGDLCDQLSQAGQQSEQNAAGRPPTARSTRELEALQALQRSMIDEFAQNPSETYAIEIAPLASFVDVDDYVCVFDKFHNIVDTELLRAFGAFIHCRQASLAGKRLNLGSTMLSIQNALDSAVDAAHSQTKYNSIRALSAVLDAMNEVKVKGIVDVKVQDLLKKLEKLRDHKELPLLANPTDVCPWKKIGGSAVKALVGGAKVAGSVWSMDPSKLVEGLVDLTEVIKSCSDLFQNVSNTSKAFKTLKEPKDWYIALRATDGLYPDLPCREDKDFFCDLNHDQVVDILELFLRTQASRIKFCCVLAWAQLSLTWRRRRKTYNTNVERFKVRPHQPQKQLLDHAWRRCHKAREFYADQMIWDKYTDSDLKLLKIERLDGSRLSMNECYINLAIVRSSGVSNQARNSGNPLPSPFSIFRRLHIWEPPESERVSLEAVFDGIKSALENFRNPRRRILIRGQADMWAMINSNLESGSSISNILSRSLPNIEKAGEGTLGEALEKSFTDDPGRTLFILDGFDEVIYRDLYTPGNELLFKLLDQPRVIITARPRGVNRELLKNIDLELETIRFYPNQVEEYIKKHASGKTKEIRSFIKRHPLDAICYSMMAGTLDGSSPPETMTELYHSIEASLCNKDVELLEKHRDGSNRPISKLELSFLRTSDGPLTPATRSYHFLHLIFQEMFAAQFFVQHWISNKDLKVFHSRTKKSNSVNLKAFPQIEKYNQGYDVFWRFVAGNIQAQHDEGALHHFFQIIEEEPRDLLGLAHLRLTMHCFAEINSTSYEPASIVEFRKTLDTKMKDWLFLKSKGVFVKTVRRLVGETEFSERLLKEAAGMVDSDMKLCMAFAYGLKLRPKFSLSLVDLVVDWSRDFADENVEEDGYDQDELGLAVATTSLLWHTPRPTPAAMTLLSKLLDHPDRHTFQRADVTVLRLAEAKTVTGYNPLIVRGLLACLSLQHILGLPPNTYRCLERLASNRPLYPKLHRGGDMMSAYDEPEKVEEALINLAKTMKSKNTSSAAPNKSQQKKNQAPPGNREEAISRCLRCWKDIGPFDGNYVKRLESIENNLSENGYEGLHLEDLSKRLVHAGTWYNILSILAAYFGHQEDVLVELALNFQKSHYYDGLVPDAIIDSVALMIGGAQPLHRAVAGIVMRKHARLPKCVLDILLDNLANLEGGARDCVLLYLATHREHAEIIEMAKTKFGIPIDDGWSGFFSPKVRGIIQDIACQAMIDAMTTPNAETRDLRFWAMEAVMKYPGSGIMELIIRLDDKFLRSVYQLWLEKSLEEPLSWHIVDNRLCVRTSLGIVANVSEGGEIISEFVKRLGNIKATLRVPN